MARGRRRGLGRAMAAAGVELDSGLSHRPLRVLCGRCAHRTRLGVVDHDTPSGELNCPKCGAGYPMPGRLRWFMAQSSGRIVLS